LPVDAICNDGTWPPVLTWLNSMRYQVPFGGRPAIIRNPDGTLNVLTASGGELTAGIGDWVIREPGGGFSVCKEDVFTAMYGSHEQWNPQQTPVIDREALLEAVLKVISGVTLVKPGETLIIRVPADWNPQQVSQYQEYLDYQGQRLGFTVLAVTGDELAIAEGGK
jgi:hypothetical protein